MIIANFKSNVINFDKWLDDFENLCSPVEFNFDESDLLSIITIRGLGVTDIQNQINQLILWFGSFEREIKNFDRELLIKKD